MAVVIVALSPAALTAIASTATVRAYLGREVARALGSELGLQAAIGEVKVDWRSLAVVVDDIDIAHPEHGPLVRAAVLRIEPSWWALVRGQLDLQGVTIERADVWLKVRDQKVVNLPELPEAEETPSEVELPFDWLQIERSRLVVDAAPWGNGEIQRIDLRLENASDGALAVDLASSAAFLNHATGTERLSEIVLTGRFAGKRIEVSNLRVRGETANVHLQDADLTLPLGTQYAGTLSLDVDIPRLAKLPHGWELPRLEGQLSVQAEVQGDERGPSGDAKVHLQRGLVKYYGFGEHVRLSVLFDRDRVRWDGVAELIREGGAVALRGELGLGEGLPLQVEADVRDVNFSKLMEQLDVSPDAIVHWTLAGGFDLKGTCDPLDLRGTLDMPTRDFRVTRDAWHADVLRPILQVPRAHLVGQVRVKPAGIFLEQIDIAMPSSRLFVERVLLGFDNELEIAAQALDWSLADSSPLLLFPLGGRGTFEVDVTGTFDEPIVSGQVAVRDFTFNAYRFGDMVSDFSVDDDLMGVRFPSMEVSKNDSRYRVREGFLT